MRPVAGRAGMTARHEPGRRHHRHGAGTGADARAGQHPAARGARPRASRPARCASCPTCRSPSSAGRADASSSGRTAPGNPCCCVCCTGCWRPPRRTILGRAGAACRRQAMVFQRPVLLRRSAHGECPVSAAPGRRRGAGSATRRAAPGARPGGAGGAGRPPGAPAVGRRAAAPGPGPCRRHEPEVLFLDEPCASLDPAATRAVEDDRRARWRAAAPRS